MGKYCDEKKEEDVETSGGGREGQKKKEIALPGFHIESLRSSGTFTPSPPSLHHRLPPLPPSPTRRPFHRPRRLLTLNFLSCITALRLSSKVKKKNKKKKEYINGRNRRRERTTPSCLRGKGVLRQICRSPSSASPPDRSSPPSLLFFYGERESMTSARSIPRRFTAKTAAKRGIPTEIYICNGAQ